MKKLRVSYTLLSLWRGGQHEKALQFYLKKLKLTSPAMEAGKKWDDYVCKYALENNKLPVEFGGDTLSNPKAQVKIEVPFNEICDVVGVFDVLTDDTLYEIKTGNAKDSSDYAMDFQVSMYLMLAPNVEKAYIVHYDQYIKEHDRTLIWNSPEERERGKNFVESLSPEIYDYFLKEGVLDKGITNTI